MENSLLEKHAFFRHTQEADQFPLAFEKFKKLPEGKQRFVYETFLQIQLRGVQTRARSECEVSYKNASLFKKVWLQASKEYQIACRESEVARTFATLGPLADVETFDALVEYTLNGPDIQLDEKGRTEVQYIDIPEDETQQNKARIAAFNSTATAFSKISDEIRFTGTQRQKRRYNKLEKKYGEARRALVLYFKEQNFDDCTVAELTTHAHALVQISQFRHTCPNAEKELEKLLGRKKGNAVWTMLKESSVIKNSKYLATGAVARYITLPLWGYAAIPIIASIVAGFSSNRRARRKLEEREALSRRGVRDTSKTAKNIIDAEVLSAKLQENINTFHAATSVTEQAKQLRRLYARIHYTNTKRESGLINYGNDRHTIARQCELVLLLSEASVKYYSRENDLTRRLDSFLNVRNKRLKKVEKRELMDSGVYNGILAGLFSYTGIVIADHFLGLRKPVNWFPTEEQLTTMLTHTEGVQTVAKKWTTDLFVIGEVHNSPKIQEVTLRLLPQLRESGATHLALEWLRAGSSTEQLINEYVSGQNDEARAVILDGLMNRNKDIANGEMALIDAAKRLHMKVIGLAGAEPYVSANADIIQQLRINVGVKQSVVDEIRAEYQCQKQGLEPGERGVLWRDILRKHKIAHTTHWDTLKEVIDQEKEKLAPMHTDARLNHDKKYWVHIIEKTIKESPEEKVRIVASVGTAHGGYDHTNLSFNEQLRDRGITSTLVDVIGGDKSHMHWPTRGANELAEKIKEQGLQDETFVVAVDPNTEPRGADYVIHLAEEKARSKPGTCPAPPTQTAQK